MASINYIKDAKMQQKILHNTDNTETGLHYIMINDKHE